MSNSNRRQSKEQSRAPGVPLDRFELYMYLIETANRTHTPLVLSVRCCWMLCAAAWPAYREHCRSLSARGRPGVMEMSSPRRGCFPGGPLVSSSPSLRRRCRRGFLGCRSRKPSGRSCLECSGQASRNISSRGACPWRRLRSRRILRWPPCATGWCQPRCLRRTVRATGALTSTPAQPR